MTAQELLNQGFQHFARKEYEQSKDLFKKAIEADES